jgi:hypothetical protein
MSTAAVQAVLERTVTDAAFRARFLSQPSQALDEYDLTPDERAALESAGLHAESETTASTALERRETKQVLPFWLTGGL